MPKESFQRNPSKAHRLEWFSMLIVKPNCEHLVIRRIRDTIVDRCPEFEWLTVRLLLQSSAQRLGSDLSNNNSYKLIDFRLLYAQYATKLTNSFQTLQIQ